MLSEGSKSFNEISTPLKFTTSNVMRLVAGNLGIVASFGLVVYAPDVIDLLLNFTAIEFVATLDNSCFELASKGFLGISIEKKAKQVENFRYEYKIRRKSIYVRFIVYALYFLAYVGTFFAIVGLQSTRQIGVENEIYVQFDDTNIPTLFGISGAYIGCRGYQTRTRDDRVPDYVTGRIPAQYTGNIAYVEATHEGNCPQLTMGSDGYEIFPSNSFLYCINSDGMSGWVFIKQQTSFPCTISNYIVRSYSAENKPSDSFDILTHSHADWFVHHEETQSLVILDRVIVHPASLLPFHYNCSDGIQLSADLTDYGALGIFRFFGSPLPRSFYPLWKARDDENDNDAAPSSSFFEQFSLVYRQVYVGKYIPAIAISNSKILNLTEFRNTTFSEKVSFDGAKDPESEVILVFFDGLR